MLGDANIASGGHLGRNMVTGTFVVTASTLYSTGDKQHMASVNDMLQYARALANDGACTGIIFAICKCPGILKPVIDRGHVL